MEQKMIVWLVLGWSAILKKKVWAAFGQKQKFESSAFAFVSFEISTVLKFEISTVLKLEISSFRRVENFKLQKG